MNASSQPWSMTAPLPQAEGPVDAPEAILADLGWTSGGAGTRRGAASARPAGYAVQCSYCWSPLAPGASACDDCGQSVAEMERLAEQRTAADRSWKPGRDGATSYSRRQPLLTVTTAPVGIAPSRPRSRSGLAPGVQTALWVGGGAVFFAGAAGLGFWLAVNAAPDISPAPGRSKVAPVAAVSGAGVATVRWSSDAPDLGFEVQTADGKSVAASRQAAGVSVEIRPGSYVVFATNKDGTWRHRWQDLQLEAGQAINLAPPVSVRAAYLTWRGTQYHESGDDRRAETSWQEAIRLDPQTVGARLELAAQLAVGFKYREARSLVEEVLKLAPGNRTALQLRETLQRLEETR